jgi:hypothetical protein
VSDYGLGPYIYDGHFTLLHHVLTEYKPKGTAVEFGTGAGESLRLIADHMPAVSFGHSRLGLPEDWREGFSRGMFACETPEVPGAEVVEGLFEDTLPKFDFASLGYIGLVAFDADLYSSTVTALKYIGPHLKSGCLVIFDEWFNYPGCEQHEQLAFRQFTEKSEMKWEVVGHAREAWAIRLT